MLGPGGLSLRSLDLQSSGTQLFRPPVVDLVSTSLQTDCGALGTSCALALQVFAHAPSFRILCQKKREPTLRSILAFYVQQDSNLVGIVPRFAAVRPSNRPTA